MKSLVIFIMVSLAYQAMSEKTPEPSKVEWEFFKLQDRETGEEIDWDESLGPKVTHSYFKAALALARSPLSIPFLLLCVSIEPIKSHIRSDRRMFYAKVCLFQRWVKRGQNMLR